jgi:AcrR family transcriptional regulator
VEAILQAAAELICGAGWDRSSTNRIAERAGISIGSLYQYFPNKEAILARLLEIHLEEAHAVADEALEALRDPAVPLAEGLEQILVGLVALHDRDPELTRALTQEVPHAVLGVPDHAEVALYAARLEKILADRGDMQRPFPALAATLIVTTLDSASRWLVHQAPPALDRRAFIAEVVTMTSVYLQGHGRS